MEIRPVRGVISISRGGNVMPMEIFVNCVDDLATLASVRVDLDLGLFSPGSFFFVRDSLGSGKFLLWHFPCVLVALSF